MWNPIILDVECIVCNKSLQKINHDPREVTRKMGKIANRSTRRSRTPNWSPEEKQYLLELISQRKEVVVSKVTNGPNHYEEKEVAWNEILTELASKFGNKFNCSSIKKVKTQWQNMKRVAREEITLNGPEIQKYTRQSLEVCNILDLIKDGVLKEGEYAVLNETKMATNVEVKAERIDEDINQPGSSGSFMESDEPQDDSAYQSEKNQLTIPYESSASSVSEQISEVYEHHEEPVSCMDTEEKVMRSVSANTDNTYFEKNQQFHTDVQDFLRFTSAEKHLKMETLKEERHVIRAMRETAELNKIIAEQRLKHVLWVKKYEMA